MSGKRGFTLIELMVAIAITAVLLTIAVPSFEATINSSRLTSSANEFVNAVQTARMEAIRRSQHTAVCFSASAESAAPTCSAAGADGWITFVDADGNDSFGAGDTLLAASTLPPSVQLAGSPLLNARVVFHADGRARDASGALLKGVARLCMETRRPVDNMHDVEIGTGSRVSTSRQDGGGTCTNPADPA
ncbi:GspH/FimT family pseudopilin [Cognatiluteimonas telluris]|jgi:type IV fimbrial biogenesis protein FimT|uniref:GspH/FimT family pseudopilin n=1 Tax=Cognatiluteimonas telluris TaxID=1104775 RepID=UPI0024344EFE|nr:GspH/FimT family pseudopilin [Lysobacter telluris]